ncbi:hypothetical protein MTR_0082s0230 [Medicago truncatula]|uniref:Uncharacterized protein n=1 Tax=Medicago truncatula TaxID=3880 RepID=A0A072TJ19_MEDTR|nr:hypothetical protein MTR_0082s0230 [Medicago truncatula]
MLKVACLPSHPLEKLVARKKRRGREAVYEASLPPVVEVLGATLIQKVTDGSRLYPVSLPASFISTASFGDKSSLPFYKMPDWSASANVQSGPLFVRRNGTTGESSAVHTWAKTTDFVWKRNTNRFPLFRVLIERSEIKVVYYKVSEVSMVFYLCVVSVHSGREEESQKGSSASSPFNRATAFLRLRPPCYVERTQGVERPV